MSWVRPSTLADGLLRALEAAAAGGNATHVSGALHAVRPTDVSASEWGGLFEFVVVRLAAHVGAAAMVKFVSDLCDSSRFARLQLQ